MNTIWTILSMTCFIGLTHGQGDLWIVDKGGGGDFQRIDTAIQNANEGDTILVRPWNL